MKTIKMRNTDASCIYAKGNGASYFKCSLTGKNCPFQNWCTRKHIFDFQGNSSNCSNYKHK